MNSSRAVISSHIADNRQAEKYLNHGFRTPSGKVEFFSPRLAEACESAVPLATQPQSDSIGFSGQEGYPVIGLSGSREHHFTNSQYFQIPALREKSAGCLVDIHPADCRQLNIRDGEVVTISTPRGSVEMEAKISSRVRPGSIRLAWGWANLVHNLNNLTEDEARGAVTGNPGCRSFMCRAEKE